MLGSSLLIAPLENYHTVSRFIFFPAIDDSINSDSSRLTYIWLIYVFPWLHISRFENMEEAILDHTVIESFVFIERRAGTKDVVVCINVADVKFIGSNSDDGACMRSVRELVL